MVNNSCFTPTQWAVIFVALCTCIPQGVILFRDAQKRGHFPWLWGIWGLMSFPLPSVFYYIFIVRRDRKKKGSI